MIDFFISEKLVLFFAAKCPIIAPAKESPAPVGSTTDSKKILLMGKLHLHEIVMPHVLLF